MVLKIIPEAAKAAIAYHDNNSPSTIKLKFGHLPTLQLWGSSGFRIDWEEPINLANDALTTLVQIAGWPGYGHYLPLGLAMDFDGMGNLVVYYVAAAEAVAGWRISEVVVDLLGNILGHHYGLNYEW